jgi:hypothetical protein
MRKIALLVSLIAVTCVVYVGQGYYQWVAQSETPFEELGIDLHKYMPAPVQAWGCERLRSRFEGKTLPPFGCQDLEAPTKWRKSGS